MSVLQNRDPSASSIQPYAGQTFNFAAALPGRASSAHTRRAYYRWVDQYLATAGGVRQLPSDERERRMEALPVDLLQNILAPAQLRGWLGMLAQQGHGKQGLTQARAAITTLASCMAEAGWLDDYTSAGLKNVGLPGAEEGQRPGRWLSTGEIRLLMAAARDVATTDHQRLRNGVVITMLCTMAMRREELASASWDDLGTQNDRIVLRVHGKGRKTALIDVPGVVLHALVAWETAVIASEGRPGPGSPLVRRIWKGGRIARHGLSADGIWSIVGEAAARAGIEHVAPHDLRRSVAGALQEAGVPVDTISRLLRHSNVAVTERYLSRLPQRNQGAVMMSDLLGLGDVDWPGF